MNKQTKIILWIIGILIVLIIGVFSYMFFNPLCCSTTGNIILQEGFDYNSYCELNKTNEVWGCFPEDRCEFQEDSDGTKYCVSIWRE
jgi:heme/copper-type cytochrome/quinol oxidase subunit 2